MSLLLHQQELQQQEQQQEQQQLLLYVFCLGIRFLSLYGRERRWQLLFIAQPSGLNHCSLSSNPKP